MTTTNNPMIQVLLESLSPEQTQQLMNALSIKLLADFAFALEPEDSISTNLRNAWEKIQADQFGTFHGLEIDISAQEVQAVFNELQGASFADKTKLSPLLWMAVEFFGTDLLSALSSISIALPTKTDLTIQKLIAMLNLHTALKNAQVEVLEQPA